MAARHAERNADVPPDQSDRNSIGINVGMSWSKTGTSSCGVNVAARLEGCGRSRRDLRFDPRSEDAAGRSTSPFDDLRGEASKQLARSVRVYRVRFAAAENTAKSAPSTEYRWLPLPDKHLWRCFRLPI